MHRKDRPVRAAPGTRFGRFGLTAEPRKGPDRRQPSKLMHSHTRIYGFNGKRDAGAEPNPRIATGRTAHEAARAPRGVAPGAHHDNRRITGSLIHGCDETPVRRSPTLRASLRRFRETSSLRGRMNSRRTATSLLKNVWHGLPVRVFAGNGAGTGRPAWRRHGGPACGYRCHAQELTFSTSRHTIGAAMMNRRRLSYPWFERTG